MKNMMNKALDNVIDLACLRAWKARKSTATRLRVPFTFPVGHSVTVPASACATGHHSLLIVFLHEPGAGEASLVEFWKEATTCKNEVHFLPKQLDEKVARLQLSCSWCGAHRLCSGTWAESCSSLRISGFPRLSDFPWSCGVLGSPGTKNPRCVLIKWLIPASLAHLWSVFEVTVQNFLMNARKKETFSFTF